LESLFPEYITYQCVTEKLTNLFPCLIRILNTNSWKLTVLITLLRIPAQEVQNISSNVRIVSCMKTSSASAYHLCPVTSCLVPCSCTTSNHSFVSSCRFVLVKNVVSESTILHHHHHHHHHLALQPFVSFCLLS
jgi:hypothetical protein